MRITKAMVIALLLGIQVGCATLPSGKYYWTNPRGQVVLVDRATNAPVR